MDSLPSFIELMASLGLEQVKQIPTADKSPSPQPSSPRSPVIGCKNAPMRTRSSSSPSLREVGTRHHTSRYLPYSPALSLTRRRGSLSSVSSSSDFESSPTFPIPPRPRPRKTRNKCLSVNVYGSSSDLAADTPISTYVRRKTPGTSPTSPTFNRDSGYESSTSPTAMPFLIPSLPVLLPNSSSSESFPSTPTSDSELEDVVRTFPKTGPKRFSKSNNINCRIVRKPTGVRISVPPYPTNLCERYSHRRSNKD
ncbi:hypothetical protein BYT27DRAFT_7195033 [Phlegmacium glaucopus]|nr:hypothetical protein BYT27DRAFT_7195033 [Phlegmacium glaucopus]